jgi:hypothetical protein
MSSKRGGDARAKLRPLHAYATRWLSAQAVTVRTVLFGALLSATVLGFIVVFFMQVGSHRLEQSAQDGWIPLVSTAPADVIASATSTPLYRAASAATNTRLGLAIHHGRLGTPQLVHAYHPQPGVYDVWVIPLLQDTVPGLSSQGPHVTGLFDLEYDQTRQLVRAVSFSGPFVPGDPGYDQPFPRLSTQAAMARFGSYAQSAHIAIPQESSLHPQLIYFQAALDKMTGPHPEIIWSGGGQFADLAVWRLADSGGHDYIVGLDGTVYPSSQLPTQ